MARRLLESLDSPEHRRLVRSFATWQVMRRLRHSAQARPRHRTRTAQRPELDQRSRPVPGLAQRAGTSLRQCRQADIDDWLATVSASAAESTRGFLYWAARHGHCPGFAFPARQRHAGPAISDSQRWEHATRLLRDDSIEPADRAAGCLVLLYGQNVTRIAALTVSQVTRRDGDVHIRLGKHDIPVPPALGTILDTLITDGKPYTGTGTPAAGKWLFPGLLPGQPITAERLSARLNAIGIPVRAARRAALTGLAAQVPAAVLADALGINPTTAVNWAHDAGSNWNRYAAELARNRHHERGESIPPLAPVKVFSTRATMLSTSFLNGMPPHIAQILLGHARHQHHDGLQELSGIASDGREVAGRLMSAVRQWMHALAVRQRLTCMSCAMIPLGA